MSKPVKQHYVPQTYLRYFCDEQNYFHSYLIDQGKTIRQTPRTTAYEKHFYTINNEGEKDYTIENILADHIDSLYQPIIKKIESKSDLTDQDLYNLSIFIAFQYLRTPSQRKSFNATITDAYKQIAERVFYLKKHEGLLDTYSQEEISLIEEIFEKDSLEVHVPSDKSLSFMMSYYEKFADMYMQHNFIFVEASKQAQFITTDNPYLMEKESWASEWSGYGVMNTFKLFPLTPQFLLHLKLPNERSDRGGFYRYIKCNRSDVRAYNIAVASNAHKFVYCRNKALLQSIVTKIY